jgi:hypothetical protein
MPVFGPYCAAVFWLQNNQQQPKPYPRIPATPDMLLVPSWLMSGATPPCPPLCAMPPVAWRRVAKASAHLQLPMIVARSGAGVAGAAGSRQREQARPQGWQHLEERSLRHRQTSSYEL